MVTEKRNWKGLAESSCLTLYSHRQLNNRYLIEKDPQDIYLVFYIRNQRTLPYIISCCCFFTVDTQLMSFCSYWKCSYHARVWVKPLLPPVKANFPMQQEFFRVWIQCTPWQTSGILQFWRLAPSSSRTGSNDLCFSPILGEPSFGSHGALWTLFHFP